MATTQTVPTWSRAAGRPPLSIRMLTLYAHASDRPCLLARERAGSLTHHQPRQSLAVPWWRPAARSAEQPQHSARGEPLLERSGSFAQRLLRSSTRRLAAASFRWTALDRSSSRSTADRAAVCLSGSAPTVRSSRRFAAALRGLRHTRRPWRDSTRKRDLQPCSSLDVLRSYPLVTAPKARRVAKKPP